MLEEKLREILKEYTGEVFESLKVKTDQHIDRGQVNFEVTGDYKNSISQIRQVFEDEGWHKNVLEPEGDCTFITHPCMTGQAWFDNFRKELKPLVSHGDAETWMGWGCGEVMEAARKASGIKE